MGLVAIIGALSALIAASGGDGRHSAVDVFRDACMDGEARLPTSEARAVSFDRVPAAVRQASSTWLRGHASGTKFHELALSEGRGYLIVQSGKTGAYCSVASKHIKYWDARVAVDQHPEYLRKISASERSHMERMGHHRTISSLGYEIEVQRTGNGFITMTTHLPTQKAPK